MEVKEAILNMRNNRSPGSDGLTPEFYKHFFDDIINPYLNMIEETAVHGELAESMKEAILALIFKKGDRHLLKNYRPISLTNYDYKILAYVLARRMQKVIKSIVNEDQSGYIKGRFIGCNIRTIEDIIDYTENYNLMGSVICLDFEKAFDSVNWYFMLSALQKFNFGDIFIKWIKILYNKPSIRCKNNGWISESFRAERGIRQGCPVSALLFLLVAEIMAIQIRNESEIKGFKISGETFKLTHYADDTTLLLSDLNSIENTINLISNFSQVSGLRLNISKCEGMWLGKEDRPVKSYCGINFTNEPIKCLGLYIGGNEKLREDLNWTKKLSKFDKLLERWKERKLTIFGKVIILKALAVSQLVFNFNLLPVPTNIINRINRSMYNFLWNANDRIRRNVLISNRQNGGIAMVDLECKVKALKAAWVSRIFLNINAKWTSFLKEYLNKINFRIELFIKMQFTNVKSFPVMKILPTFYQDILVSFNTCKVTDCIDTENALLCKVIWGNNAFSNKGKCLYLPNWIKSGFIFVKDLFDEKGVFLSENTICERLCSTKNWISEYLLVKKCIMLHVKTVDCSTSQYINTSKLYQNMLIHNSNKQYDIRKLTSKFYYQMLVKKKCVRNYTEKCWQKQFGVSILQGEWEEIYYRKVWNIQIKKIAEFNYKLIHKLVYGKYEVSRWKKDILPVCINCGEIDNAEHMLFKCNVIQSIWQKLSQLIKVNITWKHIVIGYSVDGNIKTFRNMIVSIVAFCIFKTKIAYEIKKSKGCIVQSIKKEVVRTINILEHVRDKELEKIKSYLKQTARKL